MVHPTQQRPFAARTAPCVAITRNGRTRVLKLRPWLVGATLCVLTVFTTAYVGAAGYLLFRDDLLHATLARQANMRSSYEDRIAALRSEIDRVTSRHVVETQGVEEQLAILLRRQTAIDERQAALADLVEQARDNGVEVAAAMSRLPRPRPQADEAPASPLDPAPLAYGPAEPEADDIITGTLIRGSAGASGVSPGADPKPLLLDVQSSLDEAQEGQSDALDALSAASEAEAGKISAALAPLGVEVDEADSGEPQGGPFIPAAGLHFAERTALLTRILGAIAALRRTAQAMPLGAPVRATALSSGFGYRMDPFLRRPALHAGLDFVAAAGTDVHATAPGTVVSAGWKGGYGQMVEIRHAGGLSTRYGHLSAVLVAPGAAVAAGAPIGRVGSTGRSTGPHLHYETRRDGDAVNPAPFLAAGRAL